MKLAPIVLFTYNRPIHTQNVLNSLANCEEAKECLLYVFCDGAKENVDATGLNKIDEVRKIVASENRFKQVIITVQEKNKGLANSIIDGVTQVVNEHGKVIVLEDDLVFSPYFLNYMNDSLIRYENDERVGEIGACNFFANGSKYPNAFFANMPDTWGWATWKNRWEKFNSDAVYLCKELQKKDLMYQFNTHGSYDMEGMLQEQIFGKVDSWAIRWQAVMVLNNWLCLYSNPAFSNHIDSVDATHAKINVVPPLQLEKPNFETVAAVELPEIISAIKKGYAGKSDYYGNYKSKYLKKKASKLLKKALLFLIPYGIVMLFKKDRNKSKNLD
jgi:glycosyltransferase involved in cell wall biosynthesis